MKDQKFKDLLKTSIKKVKCSDWNLTWGLGTNKLGVLHKLETGYLWKGTAQGRHGQKYGSGFILFDANLNRVDSTKDFGYLTQSEVINSVNILNN